MRTILETLEIYKYEELTEGARKRALDDFQTWGDYPWARENFKSWEAFATLWNDNDLDYSENLLEDVKSVFGDYVYNNADFTGYCMDYTIISVLRDYVSSAEEYEPHLLYKRINSAYHWECQGDYEHYYSEESFIDLCHCNEWEFLQDGSMYRGGK